MERTALLIALAVLLFGMPAAPAPATRPATAPSDAALASYSLALEAIGRDAMFAAPLDRAALVTQSLKDWLAARDRYGDYLTPAEYARYRQIMHADYAGVGLTLTRMRDGSVICEPWADGPAARAGIRQGDRLIALDNVPVQGAALPTLAARAAGNAGTPLTLDVTDGAGVARRFVVTRASLRDASVTTSTVNGAQVLRITRFAPDTSAGLDVALRTWPAHATVIVDLRGCGGGDFYASVDSAMRFLGFGEVIVSVEGHLPLRRYESTIQRPPPAQPVVLWQDAGTASAAELFIAALVAHGRARSVGAQSAGKGSRQDVIALADGAALVLTTGYLLTPGGVRFDGIGLAPQTTLAAAHASTADYLRASGVSVHDAGQGARHPAHRAAQPHSAAGAYPRRHTP